MFRSSRKAILAGIAASIVALGAAASTTLASGTSAASQVAAISSKAAATTGTALASKVRTCASRPSAANCDGVQVTQGDACDNGAYPVNVPGSQVTFADNDGYTFWTVVMYSPQCKSSYAYTFTSVVHWWPPWYGFSNKIRRGPGADGPYLMEHAPWYKVIAGTGGYGIFSPLVYSPHNKAQACFSNDSNDQIACTSWI
jgi:hypothetical protein